MESQPQNPEFRINPNPEKCRPCTCFVSNSIHKLIFTKWLDLLHVSEVVV